MCWRGCGRVIPISRAFHAAGDPVGIHDDPPLNVAGGAANCLDQRGLRPQKALLVGVEDRDKAAFGDIEAFAQKVDPDQNVESPKPQIAQDLDPLDRVDIGVHIAHADALFVHIFGQVFGHPLGERRDEDALAPALTVPNLGE